MSRSHLMTPRSESALLRVDRYLLWSGIAAPVLVSGGVLVESLARPTVNPIRQSISLLIEGSSGRFLRIALVLGGLLMCLYAWSFNRCWRRSGPLALSQTGVGIGLILTGVFIQQGPAPRDRFRIPSPWGFLTAIGAMHVLGALILYSAVMASCLVLTRDNPDYPIRGASRRYSQANAAVMAAALLVFVITATDDGPSGLFERIAGTLALTWQVWFTLDSIARYRRKPNADP